MYSFLKILVAHLVPIPLCLGILLIGLIFLWVRKKQAIGKIIVTVGFLLLLIFSFPPFSNLLLSHLEQQYASFDMDKNEGCNSLGTKYIVVLAGGHILDPEIPITSQFSYAGLVRLVEGIRLYKKCPGAKLILSARIRSRTNVIDARLMADLSIQLDVPKEDIIIEPESMSTFNEGKRIKHIVKNDQFLLVTSASHMLRSITLFRKLGMNPIPAPTGHLVKKYRDNISVMPSASNLLKSDTMIRELLALVKEKLVGRI